MQAEPSSQMIFKPLRVQLFLAVCLVFPVTAQVTPRADQKEDAQRARQELERKTLALLDATLEDAQLLKLAENRALVQATAADLLWSRDEKRARILFRDAMSALFEAMCKTLVNSNRDRSLPDLLSERRRILSEMTRHDAQLALDLLRETQLPLGRAATGQLSQDLRLEETLAIEVAASDPKLALQMAEASLSKGISTGLLGTLQVLQQKDRGAATRLASEIVRRLESEDLNKNTEAALVAQSLLNMAIRPPGAASSRSSAAALTPTAPLLDNQLVHGLAETIVTAALNASAQSGMLRMVQSLMPDLAELAPGRVSELQLRLSPLNGPLDPEAQKLREYRLLMKDGTVGQILAAADAAPLELQEGLYGAAVQKLVQSGDLDLAREIASENLSGQNREHTLELIDQQALAKALKQKRMQEARLIALRARTRAERAIALARVAALIAASGDAKLAREWLEEANSLVTRPAENQDQLKALLQIASAYAQLDPDRTFELIEPIVEQANEMAAAAALIDKFSAEHTIFKKGEFVLHPGFSTTHTFYTPDSDEIAELVHIDFDRTKALAGRLKRVELRLMAHLLIVQAALADRPGPARPGAANHATTAASKGR